MVPPARASFSELYAGLHAIARDSFPKGCPTCGRRFETAEAFLAETEAIRASSGLKQGYDDDDRPLVELFRNCPCGSTLLEFFADRRAPGPAGERRRERFGELLKLLQAQGLDVAVARRELVKVLRGGESSILRQLGMELSAP